MAGGCYLFIFPKREIYRYIFNVSLQVDQELEVVPLNNDPYTHIIYSLYFISFPTHIQTNPIPLTDYPIQCSINDPYRVFVQFVFHFTLFL